MKPKRSRVPHQSTAVKSPGWGTLGISGWGCAAGTLEPLAYTRASSAKFCYPVLEYTPQIPPSIVTIAADLCKFKLADLIFFIFLSGNSWFP